MAGIALTPCVLGAALSVQDSTALAAYPVNGITLGTIIYNVAVAAPFMLQISSASLVTDQVVAVSGVSGARWVKVSFAPPSTQATVALARAQSLLGSSVNAVLGTDYDTDQWFTASIGGGATASGNKTARAGVLTVSSSAISGSLAIIRPHGTPSHVAAIQTDIYYARVRARITTTPDAQAALGVLDILPPTTGSNIPCIQVGALGSVSTTLLSTRVFDSSSGLAYSQASAVAIDTAWHTFEAWVDGTTATMAIDGAVFGSFATSGMGTATAGCLGAVVTNGTTAANQSADIDSAWICVVSN
jgi:hypothetical protein